MTAFNGEPGIHESETSSPVVMRASGLSQVYTMGEVSVHALKDVDMELHEGELLVLLGNAGSSTLKLAVAGAPEPASSGAWQAAPHGALLK